MKHRISAVIGAVAGMIVFTQAGEASAQAESYQLVRIDTGISGSYASAFGRGGFGAVAEPKLMLHDNVAIGARLEAEVMFGGNIDTGGDDVSMEVAAVAGALVKAEYLHGHGPVRPFGGLALGMYDIGSQSVGAGGGTANVNQKAGRYFGVAPQVGVDLGRVRLGATYNRILGADVEVTQTVGNVEQTASYTQSYFTFELTFRFGGSRKIVPPPPPAPAVAGY